MINGFRFIIGTGCNYNCFYCHHEGIINCDNVEEKYEDKILKIFEYCEKYKIYHISITGGEPFIYWKKLQIILSIFNDSKYHLSLNTNAILIKPYIAFLKKLKSKIELHINVSSLQKKTHELISRSKEFDRMLNNLQLLAETKIKVCLNTILLKNVNDNEIIQLIGYCKNNNFVLRLLQYLPNSESDKKYVINEIDLKRMLPSLEMSEILSYGIYKCQYYGNYFEFVKNLCCDRLCDRCKEYTFVHFTPDLKIKMCMNDENTIKINYDKYINVEKVLNSI